MSLDHDAVKAVAASIAEERRACQLLTTSECARVLGMSGEFVRGEIREGRLKARVLKPPGRRRARYRIEAADFDAYQREHWTKAG